ncbi:MAG: methionine--tRNA ligase [Planctomycetota bacterium]
MPKTWYVTTPLYYVNGAPHIGSAYTTVLADVLARYYRLLGRDVFFLTGTDEHGQKVSDEAKASGRTPQEQCDLLQQRFRDAWARLEIRCDDFIRTTEPRHERVVTEVLQELHDRGEIYAGEYEGWYDKGSEIFVTEKEIEEGGLDRSKLQHLSERNYFFRMGKYRDRLVKHISSHPRFIRPESRRNEVLGFLKKDLGDLCISRPKSRLDWGIPLPFDEDYVTYVWFDALLNYVTAPGLRRDETRFERLWPADLHLIGKDILTTHCVYWPTMLMAMGVELPSSILAHGWWLVEGAKMAKSGGNVVDPLAYAESHGVDPLRYFLMREMIVGQDTEFSDARFMARYDGDLANEWGNLLARVLTMMKKFTGGRIPEPSAPGAGASAARETAEEVAARLPERVEDVELHKVAEDAMAVFRAGNRHVDLTEPWKLAKDPARKAELADALYTIAESIRFAASMLAPVLPEKSAETLRQLGHPPLADLREALTWGRLVPGVDAVRGENLFPRIE